MLEWAAAPGGDPRADDMARGGRDDGASTPRRSCGQGPRLAGGLTGSPSKKRMPRSAPVCGQVHDGGFPYHALSRARVPKSRSRRRCRLGPAGAWWYSKATHATGTFATNAGDPANALRGGVS